MSDNNNENNHFLSEKIAVYIRFRTAAVNKNTDKAIINIFNSLCL